MITIIKQSEVKYMLTHAHNKYLLPARKRSQYCSAEFCTALCLMREEPKAAGRENPHPQSQLLNSAPTGVYSNRISEWLFMMTHHLLLGREYRAFQQQAAPRCFQEIVLFGEMSHLLLWCHLLHISFVMITSKHFKGAPGSM